MDDELLKLECLKLALDKGMTGKEARDEAQRIYDWTKGRGQKDNTAIGSGSQRADVRGKDGEMEKPFRDYLSKE